MHFLEFFDLLTGRNLDSDKNDKITKFVKLCMEKYMANESKQLKEDMAYKVNDTARRCAFYIASALLERVDLQNQTRGGF